MLIKMKDKTIETQITNTHDNINNITMKDKHLKFKITTEHQHIKQTNKHTYITNKQSQRTQRSTQLYKQQINYK